MPRLGIVGFANTGKTTLFNALTGLRAPTGPHVFTTLEPNLGIARVPDNDLDTLGRLERSAKVTHATLELLDLPAFTHPEEATGPGGRFLHQLREMDGLIIVLGAFHDQAVASDSDARRQAEELLLELTVADHDLLTRRAERLAKEAGAEPPKRALASALAEAAEHVGRGHALRTRTWATEAEGAFRDSPPLTLKPTVWVINVDEGDTATSVALQAELLTVVPAGDVVVSLSARIEEEGAMLTETEREELFQELGLGEGALATVVKAAYHELDLITFYTSGEKEARAWTVRRGAKAPEAAGRIHTDFERGFIRAEVATIGDVIAAGGWEEARRAGRTRVEGKAYEVKPGDVLSVRFSV
ncbi:MAG TPA: DUF933 domain-containing protein [Acidimicrobiia bacterium]|jgi:GTP-binding protein YchF